MSAENIEFWILMSIVPLSALMTRFVTGPMLPRFWRDMPRPCKGKYHIEVVRTVLTSSKVVYQSNVNGRLRAYLLVRWHGFTTDMVTPYWDGEVEIDCNILEKEEKNAKKT